MATKVIPWTNGNGNITLDYDGQGDGTIVVTSDDNNLNVARQQTITVKTTNNLVSQTITIRQAYSAAYADQYFTIVSLADNNTIAWRYSGYNISRTISVSTDGGITWANKTSSRSSGTLATLNTGDTLLIKGSNTRYASSTSAYNYFVSSGNFEVYGNVMSLISGDNFKNTTSFSQTYALERLFYNCTRLKDASNLILPATSLTNYCYYEMFRGCTGFSAAPTLPATTLAQYCYYQMFYGCTSLNSIKCLATNITASNCTTNWVYNVASTGTFTKDILMSTWTTGVNGIPTNWTVQDEGEVDISNATVTAATQTYTGNALTPAPTVTLNGQTIPSTGYIVVYGNNTNAGTATITVTGTGNYIGTAQGTFTINKANPTYTAPTAVTGLTYDISAQNLITAGSTSDGTIQYSSDGTNWGTTIPQGTNAGIYTSYWRLVGDSNHNDVSSTSVSITIAKRGVYLATAPSKVTGLTYTGSAQNLLSGGSCVHSSTNPVSVSGTWTYPQGTNAGTYSSLAFTFTPTDTTNYNTLTESQTGSVSIAKASRTISFTDFPQSLSVGDTATLVAQVSAGSGDGTITFASSDTSVVTVSGNSNTITAVGNGRCTISATVSAGTNYDSATTSASLSVGVPYEQMYLTIASLADSNTITLKFAGSNVAKTVSVSTDGGTTWTSKTSTSGGVTLATLNTGDTLMIKGSNTQYATGGSNYNYFTASQNFEVYGNLMSLIGGDSFSSLTSLSSNYTFLRLFYNCTKLKDATNLIMPATTLKTACYYGMFRGCSGMTGAPTLPATTLQSQCYYQMFYGCSSLTTAPFLPAATLVSSCYNNMFYNCSSLSSITCLATDISASNCLSTWVDRVAASGTFIKDSTMTGWPTGTSGIPSGWTVVDDA